MPRMFRRFFAALCIALLLPAAALALTGQNISTYLAYYKDDVAFLNENTGRHLLPVTLEELPLDNGRTQYSSYSETLHVTIRTDAEGTIETCEIRLLIPEGMEYGNSLHRDFITAGYHSYAFIMAMHASAEPSSRYLLVQEISAALEDNFGYYERQLASYTVTCTRVIGEGAVFIFSNNGIFNPDIPGGQETPEPIVDDDEASNYG